MSVSERHTHSSRTERSPFLRSVREVIRTRGLAYKTEKTYLGWIEVVIPFLAEAIAYFGFNLFSDYFLNKNVASEPSLTPKPLKLLSILAKDGLTLKESTQKLCISVDTANKHVAADEVEGNR